MQLRIISAFLLCFFLAFSIAQAEDIPHSIPNAMDPGLLQKRLQGDLLPVEKRATPIRAPLPAKPAQEAAEEKIHFKLMRVMIEGNTVFSTKELETAFQPFYQKTISLAKLRELVNDITKKYREAGYILSRAFLPPQTIDKGMVKIQIIEGFISHIEVQGNPGINKTLIEKYVAPVTQSRPLQINTLERVMLLANDTPGLTIKAVITPSKTIPGSADLTLVADQKSISAFASYDNYGTRFLGPNQLTSGVSVYSFFSPGNSDEFRIVKTTKFRELQFFEFTHSHPLGSRGARLTAGGNYAETQPEFTLQPFEIIGRSLMLFTDIFYPLVRSRTRNFSVHSSVNYENVTSTILQAPFYQDRIRSLIIGGNFNAIDHLRGINNIGLDYEHGFPILGAHDHAEQSRPNGKVLYNKFNLNLSRLQVLSSRFSFLAAAIAQYSYQSLLATEQFSYGGPDYGRGYDPAEIVGDRGVGAKFELRLDSPLEWKLLKSIQYYAFYDAGIIWNIDKVNMPGKQDATSTGFGARFVFIPNLTGNLFLAKPLTRKVAVLQAAHENANGARIFFQLVANI